MNLAEMNAAHAVVDESGNLIAVTLNQSQARDVARLLASAGSPGRFFRVRPATEDDVAALGRRVDDDIDPDLPVL